MAGNTRTISTTPGQVIGLRPARQYEKPGLYPIFAIAGGSAPVPGAPAPAPAPPGPAPAPAPPAPAPAPPTPAPAPAPAPPAPTPPESVPVDPEATGFPANTPVEQMKAEEQTAYWKYHARKHESRVKQFGDLTPEQVRQNQERLTQLERDLMSETERQVDTAKQSAATEARQELVPALLDAEFRAAAGDRLTADQVKTILAPLDKSYFLDASGKVDAAKVKAYVDEVAPDKGGNSSTRRGPSGAGAGRSAATGGGSGSSGASGVAAGREMFTERHKPTTQSQAS